MSKQQQQQNQQHQLRKKVMKNNKSSSSAPPNHQCHDRRSSNNNDNDSKNNDDGALFSSLIKKPSGWLLLSSSSRAAGYFSLVIIVTIAMKFSFIVGQYAGTSLDIHLPEPLLSLVLMMLMKPRDSLLLHNSQLHPTLHQTQQRAASASAVGFQVVVTIDNVNEDFLSSEDSLTNAMMTMVKEQQQLVLLSHHCHSRIRSNSSIKSNTAISCVGIFPDSHLLIHAWPIQNKVRVQFFTSHHQKDSQQLLHQQDDEELSSIITAISKAFDNTMSHHSIPKSAVVVPSTPRIQSSVKLRGFDSIQQQQQIIQLQEEEDETYHEALIHPAMLVHPNPRRVAVIGSGSSSSSSVATVRQVLKHQTVETVVVFAKNNIVCSSDNDDLMAVAGDNSAPPGASCLNDTRVVVVVGQDDDDAASWFIDRFSVKDDAKEDDNGDKTLFDVVIIDSIAVPSSLIGNTKIIHAIHNALSRQGVLIADVGIADRLGDAGWNYRNMQRLDMIKALWDANFASVKTYTEAKRSKSAALAGSSTELRLFHIAFCDFDSKARWYMNQAEIDLELDKRMIVPTTVSGVAAADEDYASSSSSLLYNLDGATIMSYQYPTRIVEEVYCRQTPTPQECLGGRGFDPDIPNVPITALEVKPSSIPGAGRGVFFKEDFSKGSYISIDSGVHGMNVMPSTFSLILKMEMSRYSELLSSSDATIGITWAGDLWEPLESYVDGYGFENNFYGLSSSAVDPGIITFVNHGCNGTNNIGSMLKVTEMTADINDVPLDVSDSDSFDDEFYSPHADRNHWTYTFAQDKTQVDVKAGTEMLDNYLFFYSNWTEAVTSLRSECQGIAFGTVVEYEMESNKARRSDEPQS